MQRAALVGLVLLGAAGSAAGQPPDTTERPVKASSYSAVGWASWYGREFHGRRTADGETFDMGGLTAAHKTMPLPCYARVTNLRNGRSMVVRINDRGPFVGEPPDRRIGARRQSARFPALGPHQGQGRLSRHGASGRGGRAGAAGEPEDAQLARRRRQRLRAHAGRSSPPSAHAGGRRRLCAHAGGRRRLCADAGGKRRLLRIERAGGGEPRSRCGPARTVSLDSAAAAARRFAAFALRGIGPLALRRHSAVAGRSGRGAVADGGDAPLGARRSSIDAKTKGARSGRPSHG